MSTDMILGRLPVADHSYVQGIHVEQAACRIASETRTSSEAVAPLYATGSVHYRLDSTLDYHTLRLEESRITAERQWSHCYLVYW